MEEARRAIVAIRVNKCAEDLATAHEDMERGRYRAAITRAYYAIFHLAGAALLTLDIERTKHSGLEAAFSEFLIRPGSVEPEYGEIYRRMRRLREDQEYADDYVQLEAAQVEQVLSDAKRFVERLERYLRGMEAIE